MKADTAREMAGVDRIVLLPGDGIGPEVTEATVRVIDALGLDISIAASPIHALLQQRDVDILEIHRARVALSAEHVASNVGSASKVAEATSHPHQ